ncbi:MAG: hypothetical protein IJ783_11510, partial [Kiritimatiellae bacterium]|nr:hypothetical protein [Kiritimatiellia bacterium]
MANEANDENAEETAAGFDPTLLHTRDAFDTAACAREWAFSTVERGGFGQPHGHRMAWRGTAARDNLPPEKFWHLSRAFIEPPDVAPPFCGATEHGRNPYLDALRCHLTDPPPPLLPGRGWTPGHGALPAAARQGYTKRAAADLGLLVHARPFGIYVSGGSDDQFVTETCIEGNIYARAALSWEDGATSDDAGVPTSYASMLSIARAHGGARGSYDPNTAGGISAPGFQVPDGGAVLRDHDLSDISERRVDMASPPTLYCAVATGHTWV